MLTYSVDRQPVSAMLPGVEFTADVVLVAPREFEVTRAQRTYREKSFTTFTELQSVNAFQTDMIKRINESLGLEALASYLRQAGLRVAILNINVAPHSVAELARKISASRAKVVGISLIYRPQVAQAIDLLEALEQLPDVKVAAGGALASFMPRELLGKLARLDAVIYGEAEETFCDFCLAVCHGAEWRDLRGIAFRDGGLTILTPPAAPLDLSKVLRPERDTLRFLQARGWRTRIASIYTSRGCMAKCTFCTGKDAYNVERMRTYRYRDPIDVVDEMQYLRDAFGVQFVYINDDNFLGYGEASRRRVEVMAEELLRRDLGIQFASECRVDGLDLGLLRLLKKAGLRQVLLGIESGSDRVLQRWRKGATVEQNRKAIELVKKAGIALEPGFILFDAHTTAQELGESLSFLRSTGLDASPMPTYLVNRLSVYPGTEIERLMRADGTLPRSPLALWQPGSDPATIRDYFQSLEYRCRDPRSEIAWRVLRRELEPVESFLEAKLPVLTNVLVQARGPGVQQLTLERARKMIRAAGRWRRGVGQLVTRMIELVIESFDQPSNVHQYRWLHRNLAAAREQYALETLGCSQDQFVEAVADSRRNAVTLDLSVVVPSAGKWSRLRHTLDALSRQIVSAEVRWEVVLVLDGIAAPDPADLARPGLDLRIVPTPVRGGRGYARNRGVDAARAEIVVFLDDDMVPAPRFVQAHFEAQKSMSAICHGPVAELLPLAYFSDLDSFEVDPALATRGHLDRVRAWARRALDMIAHDPAAAFASLGTPSRLERDGVSAWSSGRMAGAVVAFAGANLSAPRRWLLRHRFDERPGTRWGVEDLALVIRLLLEGQQMTVADSAQALHLSHYRADWHRQQRANAMCLDFLPAAVGEMILAYLEGDASIDGLELMLQPYLEYARRLPRVVA